MALTHAWQDMVHDMRDEMHDIATITHVEPARQAFLMLWGTFVIAPVLFGIDKFAGVLTGTWEVYLPTWMNDLVPGNATDAMYYIGVVEIAVGLLVALAPRIGAWVAALWLVGMIVNLVSVGGYDEFALLAAALVVGAVALARLASGFHHREGTA
jgi:hypothetical protein